MTTKKKLGRPKLPKGEARNEILQIRITKVERALINKRAGEAELAPADWIRKVLLS
jgi:hypothetical protein